MADNSNPLAIIFGHFADVLHDAPGARKLERLAKTAGHVPAALIDDLAELILKLDDVELVGNDIGLHLFDVGYCEALYHDATQFASALRRRLENYVDNPDEAAAMRRHYEGRIAWWRMALGRASELSRWPALVLMRNMSNG